MPEKTLKEKASDLEVELARVYDELRSRYSYDAARVVSQARLFIHERTKALTALEKRVAELKKDKLTLFERQALSVVLTWQNGGWDNNEQLRKAMLVFYATCREQYPDIILGIRDLSEEARDGE